MTTHLAPALVDAVTDQIHTVFCVPGARTVRVWTDGHHTVDRARAVTLLDGLAGAGYLLCAVDYLTEAVS